MPVQRIEPTTTTQVLGRHTRLGVRFQWLEQGEPVDLDGFTARVWVSDQDGAVQAGSPHPATIVGTKAVYQMTAADLQEASANSQKFVYFTCVAEKGDVVLPPNKRGVLVGDWTGADQFTPAGT